MKNKQKPILGFAVLVITAIFTMAGCATLSPPPAEPTPPPAELTSDFIGTWERVDQSKYTNTLTITSRAIKASNQSFSWTISSIEGDSYRVTLNDGTGSTYDNGTIKLKLVGGYLEIIDAYDLSNASDWIETEYDWTGTWKKK